MKWFIDHPARIAAMGDASREYCTEKFDVNKVDADMICIMGL